MKTSIGIALVLGILVVGTLGTMVFRGLRSDGGAGLELQGELAQRGLRVATAQGCVACHTLDGSRGIGPTWLGMYGKTETLANGATVTVDEAYIRESITDPAAKLVSGYDNVMIRYDLPGPDMEALVEFTRQLRAP